MNFEILLNFLIFFGLFMSCQTKVLKAPDIFKYFNINDKELRNLTWAHGANSKRLLRKYIDDDSIHMIEGDVTEGKLISQMEANTSTLIMAKPPRNTSDVTLMEWMEIFIEATKKKKKKGAKLNFEDINVAVSALGDGLQKLSPSIDGFPFWLHTNILKGPGAGDNDEIVNSDVFLSLCTEFFSQAVLSLGWTTVYKPNVPLHYDEQMIDQMISVVKKNNVKQPVTFPIRASFDNHSIVAFEKLLKKVPQGSLTVWSKPTDQIEQQTLVQLSKEVGDSKAYFNLPEPHLIKYREARSRSLLPLANFVLVFILSGLVFAFDLNCINHYVD